VTDLARPARRIRLSTPDPKERHKALSRSGRFRFDRQLPQIGQRLTPFRHVWLNPCFPLRIPGFFMVLPHLTLFYQNSWFQTVFPISNEEAAELVHVLRLAGFAAWLRMPNDLNPPTTLHIHAVAVGDRELSTAARRQLDGPEGYFRGLDGIPPEFGGTRVDRL
jgi:hypothetical protein